MTTLAYGVVKEGRIIPDATLPEGARVEIVLVEEAPALPGDLHAELRDWDRASANSLDVVERLAQEWDENAAR